MKLLMATNNAGKAAELSAMLSPLGFTVLTLKDIGKAIEVEEDGKTFRENAIKKALETHRQTNLPSIGDDSGLCVEALDGRPGIYSARWAGENATQSELIGKLWQELSGHTDRRAYFISCLALVFSETDILCVEGRCDGIILDELRGTGGFGYDPVFYSEEAGKTFAQMTPEEKNTVSHRARAIRALAEALSKR